MNLELHFISLSIKIPIEELYSSIVWIPTQRKLNPLTQCVGEEVEKLQTKTESCRSCATEPGKNPASHPDHSASKRRINRVKGQLDAVSRMIDEREYCPDIIQQIRAATSALRGLEAEVLRGHLRGCVRKAFESENSFEVNDKIEEILNLLSK